MSKSIAIALALLAVVASAQYLRASVRHQETTELRVEALSMSPLDTTQADGQFSISVIDQYLQGQWAAAEQRARR
jgi:hypothetical protein